MQKVVLNRVGGADVLEIIDAALPRPRPGEIVVEVQAAGVNYIDIYQREGHIDLPRPFSPGFAMTRPKCRPARRRSFKASRRDGFARRKPLRSPCVTPRSPIAPSRAATPKASSF